MSEVDTLSRRRLVLQAVAGTALIILGAAAYLWIVFDDELRAALSEPTPAGLSVWAVVRVASAAALAGGTWLLAVSQVTWRRQRGR